MLSGTGDAAQRTPAAVQADAAAARVAPDACNDPATQEPYASTGISNVKVLWDDDETQGSLSDNSSDSGSYCA